MSETTIVAPGRSYTDEDIEKLARALSRDTDYADLKLLTEVVPAITQAHTLKVAVDEALRAGNYREALTKGIQFLKTFSGITDSLGGISDTTGDHAAEVGYDVYRAIMVAEFPDADFVEFGGMEEPKSGVKQPAPDVDRWSASEALTKYLLAEAQPAIWNLGLAYQAAERSHEPGLPEHVVVKAVNDFYFAARWPAHMLKEALRLSEVIGALDKVVETHGF